MLNFDKDVFFWRISPSLAAFGAHGHVRFPTFDQVLHASDLEITFGSNFLMILHGFASRNPKNIVFQFKNAIFD